MYLLQKESGKYYFVWKIEFIIWRDERSSMAGFFRILNSSLAAVIIVQTVTFTFSYTRVGEGGERGDRKDWSRFYAKGREKEGGRERRRTPGTKNFLVCDRRPNIFDGFLIFPSFHTPLIKHSFRDVRISRRAFFGVENRFYLGDTLEKVWHNVHV